MRMRATAPTCSITQTDYGVKADELATLLDELLEQPDTKVGRLQPVAAHARAAGAPAARTRAGATCCSTAACRAASARTWSTASATTRTAGCSCRPTPAASGLNLQHASVVVNMDLPWNPAVLEQRIGRVHRLGQTQPVRVVNFVAQGTIEEGMLSVLKFKKSLFAGVLDGGEKEVFLGGSRLTKFMETVEKATTAIPEPVIAEQERRRSRRRTRVLPRQRRPIPGQRSCKPG